LALVIAARWRPPASPALAQDLAALGEGDAAHADVHLVGRVSLIERSQVDANSRFNPPAWNAWAFAAHTDANGQIKARRRLIREFAAG
jgi:hypothetical protein